MSEYPQQVAIYARVSSDHQAKAGTIGSQVAALKGRVEEDGYAADDELCFLDDGYRGGTLVRPGLERLRDVAYAGAIDRVYVHSPDRLARKYAYQVLLVDELTKAGVEVVFLNHTISDSPEDELLLQMQGMIAEYERAKILERSRRGKRHAARRGSVNVLGGAPYGYYRCIGTDAYRFAGERVCDNKQVRTDLLEEAVWDDICQLLRDPDRVRREYERRLDGGSQQASARRKQLEATMHKVQRAIARLIDVYEEDLLTKEEFEPRIRASKSRLSKLQEEEKALSAEQIEQAQLHVVIDRLEAFQKQLADGLDELDWHTRREVIRLLVKRVEIDRNEVRVIYKVSPPPFVSSPASGACLPDCWRCNRGALRRSPTLGLIAVRSMPPTTRVGFLHRHFQPHLNQTQHMPVADASGNRLHQFRVRDAVEIAA